MHLTSLRPENPPLLLEPALSTQRDRSEALHYAYPAEAFAPSQRRRSRRTRWWGKGLRPLLHMGIVKDAFIYRDQGTAMHPCRCHDDLVGRVTMKIARQSR